ncbi:hypothetical protein ACFRNT_11510 [Streptomyces sp. NPDC056697]|uniref:hypothetical protein n=1 Tax=Streptomyces sp. NPDC056697 TaxID=3345915 RepID=UPI003679E1E8
MPTSSGVLTDALSSIWTAVQADHPELPDVMIAISAAPAGSDHGPERWQTADGLLTGIVVDSATLSGGADAVLTHILHESAHVLNWLRGVKDTTTRGAYHNRNFLVAAEEVGLRWPEGEESTYRGWAAPVLTDEARQRFDSHLTTMADAIEQTLPALTMPKVSRPRRDREKIACQCDPPRLVRVSQLTLAKGPIICGVCGKPFASA